MKNDRIETYKKLRKEFLVLIEKEPQDNKMISKQDKKLEKHLNIMRPEEFLVAGMELLLESFKEKFGVTFSDA